MSTGWLRALAAQATPPRPIPDWWSDEAIQDVKRARLLLDNRSPDLAVLLADAIDALEIAEKEASAAHDAIWDSSVEPDQILHDHELEASASSAIWRLHEAVRPLLARFAALQPKQPA